MRLVQDSTWAALTIWMEARGQPFEGKVAVAEVIRNRTRMCFHSNGTVPDTCLRPYQFSCWNTKDPNRLKAAVIEDSALEMRACIEAWKKSGEAERLLPLEAVFYLNEATVMELAGKLPDWAREDRKLAIVGDHTFYRA